MVYLLYLLDNGANPFSRNYVSASNNGVYGFHDGKRAVDYLTQLKFTKENMTDLCNKCYSTMYAPPSK